MGYDSRRITVDVHCRVSRHNSPQDAEHDALVDEMTALIRAAVEPIVSNPRYAAVEPYAELPGVPASEPDGTDETDGYLSVVIPSGPVVAGSLTWYGIQARCGYGMLLPFTYRDPYDPEDPEKERPLRRARLLVHDDGLVPGEDVTLVGDRRSFTPRSTTWP